MRSSSPLIWTYNRYTRNDFVIIIMAWKLIMNCSLTTSCDSLVSTAKCSVALETRKAQFWTLGLQTKARLIKQQVPEISQWLNGHTRQNRHVNLVTSPFMSVIFMLQHLVFVFDCSLVPGGLPFVDTMYGFLSNQPHSAYLVDMK